MESSKQIEVRDSPIRKKWGEALNGGFVVVPTALFRHQAELKLSDGEVVVLINLLMSWWETDDLPFPRTATLAKRMGITTRSVQRHIENLEQKRLIQRIWDRSAGKSKGVVVRYDLGGIVAELKRLGSISHPARQTTGAGTLALSGEQGFTNLL